MTLLQQQTCLPGRSEGNRPRSILHIGKIVGVRERRKLEKVIRIVDIISVIGDYGMCIGRTVVSIVAWRTIGLSIMWQ